MELGRIESVEAHGAEVTQKGNGAEVRVSGAAPPFANLPLAAHFETTGLFVKGRTALRRVDVSLQGPSQFDEEYDLVRRMMSEDGLPRGTPPVPGAGGPQGAGRCFRGSTIPRPATPLSAGAPRRTPDGGVVPTGLHLAHEEVWPRRGAQSPCQGCARLSIVEQSLGRVGAAFVHEHLT